MYGEQEISNFCFKKSSCIVQKTGLFLYGMHLRGHAVQKTATLLYGLPAVSGEGSKSVMNLLSVLDIPFDEFGSIAQAVFEDVV